MKINCTASLSSDKCLCNACSVPTGKGVYVEVYKGRKVPKGTKGIVFWYKDDFYGPKLGLKDSLGNVHWTAATNCRTLPIPEEVQQSVDAEKQAYEAFVAAQKEEHINRPAERKPTKGKSAQILSGKSKGIIGTLFWQSPDGDRVGIKDARGVAHWCKVWECEAIGPWTESIGIRAA